MSEQKSWKEKMSSLGTGIRAWFIVAMFIGGALMWAMSNWGNSQWFSLTSGIVLETRADSHEQRLTSIEISIDVLSKSLRCMKYETILGIARLERAQLMADTFRIKEKVASNESTTAERRYLESLIVNTGDVEDEIERIQRVIEGTCE